ncbi:GNAT family N-acetyltransferase [Streptosporangium sp. NPDC000396]|uniref:GNAT family N-acetyltransferase n=1 Tax=Streptosporangium sp. NPDC000396 TaxID=3366185 RepID=UPI0036B75F47
MIIESLAAPADGVLPESLLAELTALYVANREFFALSGDFPDPDDIRPEQVAAPLVEEMANPDTEVLLGRSEANGRLVGITITLARHPSPADPDPWIGLLLIDARVHRSGYGRELARTVEERFRAAGRTAVRLAVLDDNPKGLAFWTALGYEVLDHRKDLELGRPCTVMRKGL